jgi:hypothetical protein
VELVSIVALIVNIVIALGYVGIAWFIVPRFDIAGSASGARWARFWGTVFFVTCAMTHLEIAYHFVTNTPLFVESDPFSLTVIIHVFVHIAQAIAAPMFLYLASKHLYVRIMNKEHYQLMVDNRLDEMMAQRTDVEEKKRIDGDQPRTHC